MAKHFADEGYRAGGLDAAVASASPHQLILMLFEGARIAVGHARSALARGDRAARGQAISKAAAIIEDGLRASLDLSRGDALADQFDALYGYIVLQLVQANAGGDAGRLGEVDELLAGLEDAWRKIGSAPHAASAPAAQPGARESKSYGRA